MSKLAHSSEEHMEQIERDSFRRDGLSLAIAVACESGAIRQAQAPDVTTREGFATDLMERIWRAAGPDYLGREALVEAVMSAARQWEAVR